MKNPICNREELILALDLYFRLEYGQMDERHLEVHHLFPLRGKKITIRETNPEKDLTVLCANCRRMVHGKKDTLLSLEELKQKIQAAKCQ
jgi:5-methylcytosine-specific restriction protein A